MDKEYDKPFGPTLAREVIDAGITGNVAWLTSDIAGTIVGYDQLSAEDQTKLDAVIDAHDPHKPGDPARRKGV